MRHRAEGQAAVQEVPVRQVLVGGDGPEVGPDERREEEKIRKVFQEERRGDNFTHISGTMAPKS